MKNESAKDKNRNYVNGQTTSNLYSVIFELRLHIISRIWNLKIVQLQPFSINRG